ncbi:MAG: Protein:protein lipoyl transferase [uncultured Rubrobacteraceae bacterium]|uniref:Protein:protein lipoyl transferase n=1 Tax=uncultured Rubrobacteraceae bacterium TaxID=349277 RepID=A0A6J4RVD8_9ACTN|nr:MAG: Protein:protein lipoyl transferase [uncultured Rubrobacteraceae bacterium]
MQILVSDGLDLPEDGFGLQQAILEEVASGTRGPATLMWSSSRYVGATRPETRLSGFSAARRLAEEDGFPVLVRNSGGGAVAANEGSISFSITFPVEDLRHGLYERYTEGAELVVEAMRRVGVEAEPGEVEGEFCPGAYSVRVGGPDGFKVAGLAQRVTRRAARMEALVLVTRTAEVRDVLARFYGALGLPFRPAGVADLPETDVAAVIEALAGAVEERNGGAERVAVEESTLERARALRGGWRAAPVPAQFKP